MNVSLTKMLTAKGYYIPKYLFQRKLELLRRKILLRKYGYLFYRKTTSKILPSQATSHYELRLKKRTLRRWVLLWYAERTDWKSNLKAEIHSDYLLMRTTLRKWKYLQISRKTSKLKRQISLVHFERNSRRFLLSWVLSKWKFFVKLRRFNKEKSNLAVRHFKSNYKPEWLKGYFVRWLVYTKASKRRKSKENKADIFYRRKLVTKCLRQLLEFAHREKLRNEAGHIITSSYEQLLKSMAMSSWKIYTQNKLYKKQNYILSEAHRAFKLKSQCFRKLKLHKDKNSRYKIIEKTIQKSVNKKLLTRSFAKLKNYVHITRIEKEVTSKAVHHYEHSLKTLCFKSLRLYVNIRRTKRVAQEERLKRAFLHLNNAKKRFFFAKWVQYHHHQTKRRQNNLSAIANINKCFLRQIFDIWKRYHAYKKLKRDKTKVASDVYNRKLETISFNKWTQYVSEEKWYKSKLTQAEMFHKRTRVREALLLIIKLGLRCKQEKYEFARQKLCRELFLAQKYLSRWKQRTIYRTLKASPAVLIENVGASNMSALDWYPICCLAPRIPDQWMF